MIVGMAGHDDGLTVSAAGFESAEPCSSLNTARYSLPDCDVEVGEIVSVLVMLPASVVSLLQVAPPLVETCH